MPITLTRATAGLLVRDAFMALSAWTNSGGWTQYSAPALLAFDPLPNALLSPLGDGAGSERDGVREPQIYVEGGTWYLLHDAGDGINGWRQCLAVSNDRGLSWERFGTVASLGVNAAVATGWLEKRGSTYYLHRVTAGTTFAPPNVGLPATPYGWDMYTAASLLGPWALVGTQGADSGTWASAGKLPGSTIFDGTTYQHFAEDAGASMVGRCTGATPDGTFTAQGSSPIANSSTAGLGGRCPENPKVFYHSGLSQWVMSVNLIATSGAYTDTNALLLSSSLTNWTAATVHIVQRASALDGLNAVGVAAPFTGPEGVLIYDAPSGMVPFVYDTAPKRYAPGWHLGREIRAAVWEPSQGAARFSAVGSTTNLNLTQSLTHGDCVAEFQIRFNDATANTNIGFWYRQDGSGNGYRLVVRNGGCLLLQKVVGGTISTVANCTTGSLGTNANWSRIKLVVAGATHQAYFDGEPQITVSDSAFLSGSAIAFSGYGAEADVRLFSMRSGTEISVLGLTPGTGCILRGAGGVPVSATVANSAGFATFSNRMHSPDLILEVGGTDYTPAGGIWGGDSLTFAGLPAAAPVH